MSVSHSLSTVPARAREQLSRQAVTLAAVLLVAIAVRVALYDVILVRADLGYWLLNGQYIAAGQTPFVDFLGRSPLFLYAYAAVVETVGPSIAAFRWFVAAWWLAAGLACYGLARRVSTHRTGLLALALATLTPFPLAYTFYSTSSSLAVAVVGAGILALVRWPDSRGLAVCGLTIGLATLSRQSLILAGPAVASWLAVSAARGGRSWRGAVVGTVVTATAALVTIVAGYTAVARFDPALTRDLILIDFVSLFVSTGRGGVPLLSVADAVASGEAVASSDGGLFAGLAAERSLMAVVATLIGATPLLVAYIPPFRAAAHRALRQRDRVLIVTALVVVGGYAAAQAAAGGLWYRAVWVGAVAVAGWVLAKTPLVPARQRTHPAVVLPLLVAGWVGLGYAARPNLLATYYAMDAVVFLSVPAAVATRHWYRETTLKRTAVCVALVLVVVSAGPLSPLGTPLTINESQTHDRVSFFTADRVEQVGDDIDARGGDVILTSQPNYVATADAQAYKQNTRALYLRHAFGDDGPMRAYDRQLEADLRGGYIDFVVWERANRQLLPANSTVRATFKECYRPVKNATVYDRLNATLYRYHGC